jgi:mitogen-activated protein kinase kinase
VQAAKRTPVDLRAWAVGLMEKDNRKSHLAPQLSPSSQDLLRPGDSPTGDNGPAYTPTSGEIPIAGMSISSPRDPAHSNRSPTRNGIGGLGRATNSSAHPGLGQRSVTSNSIPKAGTPDLSHPASASANQSTFSLPVRPGPPGGPLPPPPPRKETPDSRRQATFGPPSNGYSNVGY